MTAAIAPVLRAEWTKFRTVRGWVIATVVAMLLIAGFGIWAASGGQSCGTLLPGGQIVARGCPGLPLGPGGEAVTDSFYFVRQSLRGDASITVRVTALAGGDDPPGPPREDMAGGNSSDNPDGLFTAGLQPWAKAGIIVAASLRPGSAYAAMLVTGAHGVRMQDDYTGDVAGLGGAVSAASPRWLRLVRSGDMLTGYDSADGAHWIRVGTVRLAGLPSVVPAGLFVTSPDAVTAESTSPTLATAAFDHVRLSGRGPGGAWRGGPVGAAGVAGDAAGGRFGQAGGTFTVSGAGDIAPAVANSAGSGKPADHGLNGAFAGLIVMIVVGSMVMTAEYRRGLIRTTLAASPRRGQVLAAKAIVAGSVTFAAALPGAAVAVLLGPRLIRGTGAYVFPAGVLTEVRVVAGTAALFALAATLALALGAILRHGAGPVTAVIAVVVLPYFFASPLALLPPGAADWLLRVTPAAGFAIQQILPRYPQVANSYTPQYGYYPLPPWAGFAVLCAWTAVALLTAGYLLRRRDA
jgi:ABC-type transport system involved in multi-copper enzyme maturation permease subunit